MNHHEHMDQTAPPYQREDYDNAAAKYEDIKNAIGGDKTDEELIALVVERSDARDKLSELYARAWEEGRNMNADFDETRRKAQAFSKLPRTEQMKELLRREFERGVEHIPEGRFTSDLPGVEQLSVLHPQRTASGEQAHSFSIYVSYIDPETQKRSGETFTVTDEGRVLGMIPRGWKFTREDLLEEVVRLVDDVGGAFFTETHDAILPPGEWTKESRAKGERSRPSERGVVDRRRVRFFKNQPGALFGFRGTARTRWEEYRGFAFSDRIILDAPEVGNAVYILPLTHTFSVDPEQLKLPPGFRVSQQERERYLALHWTPFAGLSKMESLENGATRVIHPGVANVDDEWERKMQEKLAR